MNRPCTYTLETLRLSPQNKKRSSIPANLSFSLCAPVSPLPKPPQRPGLSASSLTLTMRASNDFPAAKEPILLSRQHTCAPPRVARCNRVATENGWLVNVPGTAFVQFGSAFRLKPLTLEAMLACWMAVRIEGEKPPETSVPRPTCACSEHN